jgi:hypothetical protein
LNSSDQIKKFLVTLAASYPGEVRPERLKIYMSALDAKLKEANLSELLSVLILNYSFFPSAKEILEAIVPPKESAKERSAMCVDRYIMYLRGTLRYEEISDYDHVYCKKRFGVDKHSVQSGAIDLNYRRKEWVDICEIDFEIFDKTDEAPLELTQGTLNENIRNLLQQQPVVSI